MPVISITLLPGYSPDVEQRLVGRVALAARSVIAAPDAGTTVFVNQASTYQRDGRVHRSGGPACADASALVREFLGLMQARDLAAAERAGGVAVGHPGRRARRLHSPLQRRDRALPDRRGRRNRCGEWYHVHQAEQSSNTSGSVPRRNELHQRYHRYERNVLLRIRLQRQHLLLGCEQRDEHVRDVL